MPQQVVLCYRQRFMPWAWWAAVVPYGALTAAVIIASVRTVQAGNVDLSVVGGVTFALTFAALVCSYGPRRAHEVLLEDEALVWRSPLRSVRISLDEVVEVAWNESALTPSEPCFVLHDNRRLVVAVHRSQEQAEFAALCRVLAQRSRTPLRMTWPHRPSGAPRR